MSSNAINTQEFAETIAATVKTKIPILEYVNKELSDRLSSGAGDTVNVLVPNFGKVSKGASFLSGTTNNVQTLGSIADLTVKVDKVPVTLQVAKVGASYDLLEKTLKLYTKESQISEPRISNLARTINAEVFKCVLSAAHSCIVGEIGFTELAEAVAYVEESRVGDDYAGMLAPLLNNSVAASGANKFANSNLASPNGTDLNLYAGVLGEWMGAMFFKSADAGSIRIGTTQANAFSLSGTCAKIADGATSLTLTGITFPAGVTAIPAGTPIVIGGGTAGTPGSITSKFTMSSVYGEDTQVIRAFVVQEDAAISGTTGSGTATVKITPVYLNKKINGVETLSSAAVPNTWFNDTTDPNSYQFICPLLQGAKYALGAVFASKSIAFASASPRPFANADSTSTTLDGEINIRTSLMSDGREGEDLWRVDCLYGMKALYGTGAVAIYGQIG